MTEITEVSNPSGDQMTALVQVIADAFHPLRVCRWLVPDEDFRRAAFTDWFRMYAEHAAADGSIEMTADGHGVALWIPGSGPSSPPPDYPQRLAQLAGPYLDSFISFDEGLEAAHPSGRYHHHLAILAVRPGEQGKGRGRALLDHHLAMLDREGIPAYLEASGLDTRDLYLGSRFSDIGDPITHAKGVVMYPMWREPVSLIRR